MALLAKEAKRLVAVLNDYDHVSADIVGSGGGLSLMVRDDRFGLHYEIGSHHDYWDFIGALVDHKQYAARALVSQVA